MNTRNESYDAWCRRIDASVEAQLRRTKKKRRSVSPDNMILAFKPPAAKGPSRLHTDLKSVLKMVNLTQEKLDEVSEILEETELPSADDLRFISELFSLTGTTLVQVGAALVLREACRKR